MKKGREQGAKQVLMMMSHLFPIPPFLSPESLLFSLPSLSSVSITSELSKSPYLFLAFYFLYLYTREKLSLIALFSLPLLLLQHIETSSPTRPLSDPLPIPLPPSTTKTPDPSTGDVDSVPSNAELEKLLRI